MAKRISKSEAQLITWALVIGLPIYGISQIGESMGWGILAGGVASVIALVFLYKLSQKRKRRAELMEKYQDDEIVQSIMNRSFWQGQTSEQLRDSLGNPVDIDEKILKTKKKEIWKYNPQGGNRFGLRITLDDDVVIGWEQKN